MPRATFVEAATARGLLESMQMWYDLFRDAHREIRSAFAFRRFFIRTLITSSPPNPMDLLRRYLFKLAPRIEDESEDHQLNRALQHLEYLLRRFYFKSCR